MNKQPRAPVFSDDKKRMYAHLEDIIQNDPDPECRAAAYAAMTHLCVRHVPGVELSDREAFIDQAFDRTYAALAPGVIKARQSKQDKGPLVTSSSDASKVKGKFTWTPKTLTGGYVLALASWCVALVVLAAPVSYAWLALSLVGVLGVGFLLSRVYAYVRG